MAKLLVNSPSGLQQIIEVTETGAYFDPSRVVWDERVDGVLPEITLGKMQRNGSQLDTLDDYLTEHAAALDIVPVPESVPMAAGRVAMHRAGVLEDVINLIQAGNGEGEIWWDTSDKIRRNFPLVETVRVAMGWTQSYVDNLFISAQDIENGG